jgi:hypothetical protein
VLPGQYESTVSLVDSDAGDALAVTVNGPVGLSFVQADHLVTLRFAPATPGTYLINVSFSDGDSTLTVTFNLVVRQDAVPEFADSAPVNGSLDTSGTLVIPIGNFATDADDAANLTFTVIVSDPSVVSVTVEGVGPAAALRISALKPGTTDVKVTAADPRGMASNHTIAITVNAPAAPPADGDPLPLFVAVVAAAAAAAGAVLLLRKRRGARTVAAQTPDAGDDEGRGAQ